MRTPKTEPIKSWLTSCIIRMDRLPRQRWFTWANRTADMCTTKTTLINTHGCSHGHAFIINLAFVKTVHHWLKGRITGDLYAFDQCSLVVDRTTNIKERNEHILIIAPRALHSFLAILLFDSQHIKTMHISAVKKLKQLIRKMLTSWNINRFVFKHLKGLFTAKWKFCH